MPHVFVPLKFSGVDYTLLALIAIVMCRLLPVDADEQDLQHGSQHKRIKKRSESTDSCQSSRVYEKPGSANAHFLAHGVPRQKFRMMQFKDNSPRQT